MAKLLLLIALAHGSVLTPTSMAQPFADPDQLLEDLRSLCDSGDVLTLLADDADLLATLRESPCAVDINTDRGFFAFHVREAELGVAHDMLSSEALESVTEVDLEVLETVGFDVSEFGNVLTTHLMVLESETPDEPAALATMTFVHRYFSDAVVAGNRIVVVRNMDGRLRSITGRWPAMDASTIIEDHYVEGAADSLPAALGYSDRTVNTLPVVRTLEVEGGTVVSAELIEKLVVYAPEEDAADSEPGSSGKTLSFTLRDGELVEYEDVVSEEE